LKLIIIFVAITLIGAWFLFTLYLMGYFPIEGFLGKLKLPTDTSQLGDSLGIINGLFSAVAVIFALIAILLQGKELKESTKAQNMQALALTDQLKQQDLSNKLNVLSVRLQYLRSEIDRMQVIINSVEGNTEQSDLFNNCVAKKNRYLKDSEKINLQMEKLMYQT